MQLQIEQLEYQQQAIQSAIHVFKGQSNGNSMIDFLNARMHNESAEAKEEH